MADHRQRSREQKREIGLADRASRRAEARRIQKLDTPEPGVAGIRVRSWNFLALFVMIAIFARYYYWTVRPDPSQPLREIGAYMLLTDAFSHGQTSLRIQPAPQLLALKDPYDPELNRQYRLHDASLYKDRFYIYFGPAPAVTLYLPYLLLTGEFLPDRIGTWVFAISALIMACLFLKLVLQAWFPESPRWLYFFFCACLGFSNGFPFLLRRPAVYETAIAAGQFFVLLALYALGRSAFGLKHPLGMAMLGGSALAAAFGSRPQLVLAAVALPWFLFLGKDVPLRERLRRLTFAVVPLAAGAVLLLIYNYVRFDSIFEFGNHYQLAGVNVRKMQYFSISRMFQNLWFSVLEPPRLRSRFPFVVLAPNPPFHLPQGFQGLEVVAGIVWIAPLILFIAAASVVWRTIDPARRLEWCLFTGTLVFLGAAWIGVDGMLGSTMRYQADFAAVLFIAAALVIPGLIGSVRPPRRAWLCRSVVALGLLGVVVNGAVGMTGYYDNFRLEAPQQYRAVEDWFSPVSKMLAWCGVPPERISNAVVSTK